MPLFLFRCIICTVVILMFTEMTLLSVYCDEDEQASNMQVDYKTYQNNKYRFSMILPSTWALWENVDRYAILAESNEDDVCISIIVVDIPAYVTPAEFMKRNMLVMKNQFPMFKLVEEGTIVLLEAEIPYIHYQCQIEEGFTDHYAFALLKYGRACAMTGSGNEKTIIKYKTVFERIVKSIKLK